MKASETYMDSVIRLAGQVRDAQSGAIEKAAGLSAAALRRGGYIFAFGTGHSHMLAEEIFYRAGGLVRVVPIFDPALMLHEAAAESSVLERRPGLAASLLDGVETLGAGGVLFLFSNSGCNTVAVEMAVDAKARGLATVCVTSVAHSRRMTSRHPEGLKLMDVCDVVIDNMGVYGDASVRVGGAEMGATSTVIGAMIMEAVVCRTAEILTESGVEPEVFASANTEGGDKVNERFIRKYGPLIGPL